MIRMKSVLLILICTIAIVPLNAQDIEMLTSGRKTSLRGLAVVSDDIVWVSGSGGTVGKTIDGGKHWSWTTVKGFERREFRDIEAFDAHTAIVIAIAAPGQILKTTDGGETWKIVFTDSSKGVFLDALDFADRQHGVAVGDPINDIPAIYQVYTNDGGNSWQVPSNYTTLLPEVKTGEAMFASSGTNLSYLRAGKKPDLLVVTGGTDANLLSLKPLQKTALPLLKGQESTGANSIAAWNRKKLAIVGGDFANDKNSTGNCLISNDGGKSFIRPMEAPHGYRSCVIFINKSTLLSCGTSGVDLSRDGGLHWTLVSKDSFHACGVAKAGKWVYLTGNGGRIARLRF